MVDLHTHSTASDGLLSPGELVRYAASCGVDTLALTDHDTVEGVAEARTAGTECGVHVIPGVELEADFALGALHVLGLGLTRLGPALERELVVLREERTKRNLGILARLSEMGIEASYEELAGYAAGGVIGRPHFAQLLVDRRVVKSYQEAFDRFLADGAAAHEPRTAPSIVRCINLIHSAGGKAVVAHPQTLWLSSWRKVEAALTDWKRLGLDGVEAYQAGTARKVCRRYADIARRLGLIVTAGSDYHGRHGRPGRTAIDMDIDEAFAAPFLDETVTNGADA